MKNKIILIYTVLVFGLNLKAQDALQTAFEKSYVQEKSGNYTGAISELKNVYHASDYETNLRLGYLHYMAGQQAESMNYYAKAMLIYPNAIEAKMGYVYPASILGKWDEVLKQYVDILKIDPVNSGINYKAGLIYYNRKNYPTAYKHFDMVVSHYPFDYDGLLMFAWTNLQLGKMNEAKIFFKRVLLLSPNDKSALEGLNLVK